MPVASAADLPIFDARLAELGLNLQGIMTADQIGDLLPAGAESSCALLVLGHGGRRLWQAAGLSSDQPLAGDPLDDFSISAAQDFLARSAMTDYNLLYPIAGNEDFVDLCELGRRLGWHHDSPLGAGVHPVFGSWFAYRVVVAINDPLAVAQLASQFAPASNTQPIQARSPCDSCRDRPCESECPAGATGVSFNIAACAAERSKPDAACALQCLARNVCPAGAQYRYSAAQMGYHYAHSLQAIRANLLN